MTTQDTTSSDTRQQDVDPVDEKPVDDTPDTPIPSILPVPPDEDRVPPERVAQMTPEELVENYAGLVKSTGQDLIQQLNCPIDLDDLIAWGYQGLLEAHQRFDPAMEVSFASFAYYRIRGAMYDGLRATGWAVRGTPIKLQDALAVNDYLESNMLSHASTPQPKSFTTSVNYLDRMVGDCVTICLLQNTELEMVTQTDHPTQDDYYERHQLAKALHKAIKARLSDDEREIIFAYHVEEWSMSEIAQKMGYSKSWVSRMNARALDKLRRAMFEDGDHWELYMIRG
jgi:RNA polymerase sigma factor for flagellar operon FliA